MKIKLKIPCHGRHAISRYDLSGEHLRKMELDVLAVMRNYGALSYLIGFDVPGSPDAMDWVRAKDFVVTCGKKPEGWVERRWPFWRPYRKKCAGLDFDFRVTYFCGPARLLESDAFLFDVVERPEAAAASSIHGEPGSR